MREPGAAAAVVLACVAGCGRVAFDLRGDAIADPEIVPPELAFSLAVSGPGLQVVTSIAPADAGGFVIAGQTTMPLDVGGGVLPYAGGEDAFIASFAADGTHRWSHGFGSTGDDTPFDVATDGAGNVYVTGRIAGDADFGGGVRTGFGGEDIFLASYGPDGTHRWSRLLGSSSNGEIGYGLASDAAGNVYATGWYQLQVAFGDADRTAVDGQDIFVLAMDDLGTTRFSASFGGPGLDQGQAIAVGADGRIANVGLFVQATNLGGGDIASAGSHDAYILVTDAGGAPLWSLTAGDTGSDRAHGVAFGPDGELYVCGEFAQQFDFGIDGAVSAGEQDGYLARFSADGEPMWMRTLAGATVERLVACGVSPDRSIVIGGHFQSPTVSLAGESLVSSGYTDALVAGFDRMGALAWSWTLGGAGADSVRDISIAPDGVIRVVGRFTGTVDFGDAVRTSVDANDGFILQLVPGAP